MSAPDQAFWIDSHCHLDADEFSTDRSAVRARARERGVGLCVIPAVMADHFQRVRDLAHAGDDRYALGIHPLYVQQADAADLQRLDEALTRWHGDPRLVAVGEIGLDFFVPALCAPPLREKQEFFYHEQLRMARRHGLPVILHVRRSADALALGLRKMGRDHVWQGIAHAFNGSLQQARVLIDLGLKLGLGGALTYERAHNIRRLAQTLPLDALVLETDAPDMPPHWIYTPAGDRGQGHAQGRNEPGELPRIAEVLARLRAMPLTELQSATTANVYAALPRCGRIAGAG